mmetsp:Transcript_4651/g.6889  ORF Transcript_4651/g.6889 Transcript_4651/m.6889 type:complete len:311 (+) Transcript_4651:58-990(+)
MASNQSNDSERKLITPSSSFVTKGPSRIFIQEALVDESSSSITHHQMDQVVRFPQELDWFCEAHKMVRLMGVVVCTSSMSSSECSSPLNYDNNRMISLDIDDGTASIRVIIHPQDLNEEQRPTFSSNTTAKGMSIDCLGFLVYQQQEEGTTASCSKVLLARSIAVCAPDAEQLRILEILQDCKNKSNKLVTNLYYDNVYMAGSPTLTTGTFSAVSHTSIVVNPQHLLQLIQSSGNVGITEQELAIVLGIVGECDLNCIHRYVPTKKTAIDPSKSRSTKTEYGLQALRHALEELQKSWMIYIGPGNAYLPM